ncbi:ATP-binding cassette sub-family G member 1-like [Topomyia yanbarensis]|uniref:ATP-binding cassette sub-family G member 1-like n=1 Tax=Topomyia yanbarensis TaxID=2498891 RepID=UPI00273B72A2|nr:ATP-binding cassette sub-family G member 1-like [Topomyia yanbarensis]XP_058818864.1 ATP-binding cassette sub-family G member 1-like [Topomyia yanbarensis]
MNLDDTVEVVIPLVKTITSLSFRNLSYSVNQRGNQKQILKNISGTFGSGRLTAVIGPSGGGKSSLMNALSGFRTQGVKGRILVNNEPVDPQKYRQLVAYTAQDVPLLPNITVQETLHFAADLKLPSSVTGIHKTKIVNDIVALLGLEKCIHNQVEVISGGERKRLSIGLELVSNPKIMFFDEPTSGLDSVASYQVVSHLKELAKQGRCVVSAIHQPSSELLELFDDIYVLTDGRCMYQGTLVEMIPTLAEAGFLCPRYYNPADFALKIASTVESDPDKTSQLMKRMESATNEQLNGTHDEQHDGANLLNERGKGSSRQYPISQFRQFLILTRRTALGTLRNLKLTRLRLMGHILFGTIIGAVFYDVGDNGAKVLSNVGCLMMMLMFIVFSNAMTVVLTFPLEMSVFIREHKSNCYSTVAYFCSKIVADFPLMLSAVTCFQLIAYYLTGQLNETNRVVMFWGICALMGWTAQMYGMVAGSIFAVDISPFAVPSTVVPMILFSGFFIRYSELLSVFKPLTYVSPFRYGFEGLALATYGFNRTEIGCEEMFCYYRKSAKVLQMLEVDRSNYWIDVAGLGVWIFVLHVSLYVSLRCKLRWNK